MATARERFNVNKVIVFQHLTARGRKVFTESIFTVLLGILTIHTKHSKLCESFSVKAP